MNQSNRLASKCCRSIINLSLERCAGRERCVFGVTVVYDVERVIQACVKPGFICERWYGYSGNALDKI